MHFQSYANKMTISLSVDPSVIPDPYLLCDDLEESLKLYEEGMNLIKDLTSTLDDAEKKVEKLTIKSN